MSIRHWGSSSIVNTTTVNNQRSPQVGAFANGTYVVVWEDDLGSSASAIKFQRFDALGKKLGLETTVPSFDSNGDQTNPSVAVLSDGNFVIVNQDSDVGTNQVSITRYTDQGVLLSQSQGQFNGSAPTVTAYQGTFWVNYDYDDVGSTTAWGFIEVSNNGTIFNDNLGSTSAYSYLSAQTAGNLVPQVVAIANNLTTNGNIDLQNISTGSGYPVSVNGAARDPRLFFVNDNFVLTFVDVDAGGNARGIISVHRLSGGSLTPVVVNNSSQLLGKEFVSDLEVVTGPDGSFFLMWKEASAFVPGDSEIHIRELAMTGPLRDKIEAVGPDLLVSNSSAGQHGVPSITKLADGRLLVAWAEASGIGDGNGSGIVQHILDPRDGLVQGSNNPALAETLYGNDLYNDQIQGLAGNDTLYGMAGADAIYGGAGNDTLNGGRGDDTLYGGADNDSLLGGLGADDLDGGDGVDTASYVNARFAVRAALDGALEGTGDAAGDSFIGVENLIGSNLSSQGDTLRGDAAANAIAGFDGADNIYGMLGDDRLTGGLGLDRTTGGSGNDSFIFYTLAEGGDTITDFSSSAVGNNDVFRFKGSGFGGLAAGAITAAQFQSSTSNVAANSTVDFFYETDTRILRFDADGSGAGAAVTIATLQVGATMTFNDILIF